LVKAVILLRNSVLVISTFSPMITGIAKAVMPLKSKLDFVRCVSFGYRPRIL
jgi:hypothetical protein